MASGGIAASGGVAASIKTASARLAGSSEPRLATLARIRRAMAGLTGWNEAPAALESGGPAADLRWTAVLSVNAALALCVAAGAANASRADWQAAVPAFYAAIAALFLPFAFRILSRDVARSERVVSVALVTAALFVVRVIREPVAFIDHDEFLHWTTANHLLEAGALFSPNALLPVSPRYPGLEIVTTALTSLSGLTIFQAALCLMAVARMTFILALFFAYERIAGSARVAACACLVYMGASTFLVFDTQYSYESLAVVFLVALLLADARGAERAERSTGAARLLVAFPIIAALAATHHMTAFFAAALLLGVALLEAARAGAPGLPWVALLIGGWALVAPLAWSRLMGNPGADYLGPVLEGGLREAGQLLTFSTGRKLFVSEDGSVAPAWQRLVAVAAVGLVGVGLVSGFFRSLAQGGLVVGPRTIGSLRRLRDWSDSRAVLLTLLTLVFPFSILFRLTKSSWEIGNRIGPFSFIGVAFVIAVAVCAFWQGLSRSGARAALVATACLTILVGGIISAEGPRILVPAHFEVSADSASIEPMAIHAAQWARTWLGEANLFAADRINRLLLSTYGRQDVASSLQDGIDTGDVILGPTLGARERGLIGQVGLDFVTVDLRISTGLPVVGVYFDGGASDHSHIVPPRAEDLLKFDAAPDVGRIFDNGSIVTYDVRSFHAAR